MIFCILLMLFFSVVLSLDIFIKSYRESTYHCSLQIIISKQVLLSFLQEFVFQQDHVFQHNFIYRTTKAEEPVCIHICHVFCI